MIFIGQNIDEEFSNQILATMLYLDTLDDSRRIYMYLNGPGGYDAPGRIRGQIRVRKRGRKTAKLKN